MSQGTTIDAPGQTPPVAERTCDSCGAPVEPHDRFCQSCGSPQPVAAAPPPVEQKHLRCDSCGAEITLDPQQRSYICPFCDSTYVVEMDAPETGRQPPEFVIGFSITPQQALEKFQEWIGAGGWFRPGDLKTAEIAEKLHGVYLPFWSFSMLAHSSWSASIGEHWYRTETYTTTENGKTVTHTRQVQETEWWNLAGRHHSYHSGYLVAASRGLSQADADRVGPFQLAALKRYAPAFLAGWAAEEYSMAVAEAQPVCQQEFHRREQQQIDAFLPGDTHRGLQVNTQFSDVNSDLILLPIYLLSYRYGGKQYRFLLNGQTGKVAGDKPLSGTRIATAVASVLLLLALIWLLIALFAR